LLDEALLPKQDQEKPLNNASNTNMLCRVTAILQHSTHFLYSYGPTTPNGSSSWEEQGNQYNLVVADVGPRVG
jgi:hypothetical protein